MPGPGPLEVVLTFEFGYLTFELVLTKWLSQNFYLMHLGKKGVGGGAAALGSLLTLKK